MFIYVNVYKHNMVHLHECIFNCSNPWSQVMFFCIHMGMSKMTTLVTVKLPRNAWHKKTGRVSKNPKFLYPTSFTPSPVALDTAWKEHPSSSAASKAYRSMKHVQTSLHCEVVCGHINIVDVNIYHIATDLWNSMNIDSDI